MSVETLTHLGRTYAVERLPENWQKIECPYRLRGSRGATYLLLRNKPKPHLLFAVRENETSLPRNWWFSDEGGTLRSLTP
jgi:hypothetical protein